MHGVVLRGVKEGREAARAGQVQFVVQRAEALLLRRIKQALPGDAGLAGDIGEPAGQVGITGAASSAARVRLAEITRLKVSSSVRARSASRTRCSSRTTPRSRARSRVSSSAPLPRSRLTTTPSTQSFNVPPLGDELHHGLASRRPPPAVCSSANAVFAQSEGWEQWRQ